MAMKGILMGGLDLAENSLRAVLCETPDLDPEWRTGPIRLAWLCTVGKLLVPLLIVVGLLERSASIWAELWNYRAADTGTEADEDRREAVRRGDLADRGADDRLGGLRAEGLHRRAIRTRRATRTGVLGPLARDRRPSRSPPSSTSTGTTTDACTAN
jgi:hypothetical protein